MKTRCLLLFLSFIFLSGSSPAFENRTVLKPDTNWHLFIEHAYEATKLGDRKRALQSLHKALEYAQTSPDAVHSTLKEIVNVLRKFDEKEKAETITNLILTPPANQHQNAFLRATYIEERRREVLKAADNATKCDDYLLADILYSSLIPSQNTYHKIRNRSIESAHYETSIVDRLVRLYIKHSDIKRAENLTKASIDFETNFLVGEGKRVKGNSRLAKLNIDLALVKMAQEKYKEAIKLFQKSVITLERSRNVSKNHIATIYSDFALTLDKAGKTSEARRSYRKALSIARQSSTIQKESLETIERNYAQFVNKHDL